MPLTVENEPGTARVRRLVITCDHCGAETDNLRIAEAGGSLTEMGWFRRFNEETRANEYFCPEHRPNA